MPARAKQDVPEPRVVALTGLAVAAASLVGLAYAFWVRTRAGQQLDQDAFDGRGISPDARAAAGDLLSTISIVSLALATLVLAALALVRHRRTLAIIAITAIGGAVLTTEVLKLLVFKRPDLLDGVQPFRNSYPSGHTTIAYAVGIAATIVAPRRARRVVAVAGFAYGTSIGLSTIVAGWHRPSDVIGGLLVATGWAAATIVVATRVDAELFGPGRPGMQAVIPASADSARGAAARRYAFAGTALVSGAWLAAVGIAFTARAGSLDLTHANVDFLWTCAAITAFAAAVFGVLLRALRPALPRRRSLPAPAGS